MSGDTIQIYANNATSPQITINNLSQFDTNTKHGFYTDGTDTTYDNLSFHTDLSLNSKVCYVPDSGPNALHLKNTTASTQPRYSSSPGLFNGNPYLWFDGLVNNQNLLSGTFGTKSQPTAIIGSFFFPSATGAAWTLAGVGNSIAVSGAGSSTVYLGTGSVIGN